MGPCACHDSINKMNRYDSNSFSPKQHNMDVEQESQEKPLDLSMKLNENKDKTNKIDDVTLIEIKKETQDDDIKVREEFTLTSRVMMTPPIVNQKICSPKVKVPLITEAKHKDLPKTVQGYSRSQNYVTKRQSSQNPPHLKQHRPQSAPKVSLHEHAQRKRNGQYISSGLSGGTCKVVTEGVTKGLLAPGWKLPRPEGIRSHGSSPIPTVVQDCEGGYRCNIKNARPSSTPQFYASACPKDFSQLKSRKNDKEVLRNVNNLVRRRNEMLCRAKDYEKYTKLHENTPSVSDTHNSFGLGVGTLPLLPNTFQLNLNYPTPVGGVTVTSDTALTVQPRGLCGGTMVSCEPSAESMVTAIHPPVQIHNIHLSNVSFSTNYNLYPFNSEHDIGSNLDFSKETKNEKPAEEEFQNRVNYSQKCQSFPDMTHVPIKEECKQLKHGFQRQLKRPSSAGNLTLLSNICSLIQDKEQKGENEANVKSPLCLVRGATPESDLPLKKRKL